MKQPLSLRLLVLAPVLLAILALAAYLMPQNILPVFGRVPVPAGSIIVFVEDGSNKKPLAGATVTIPETGQSFATDSSGKTETIKVPILEDSAYRTILPKPWGEITLLVYKQGFIDCAIFHVNIWENQTRSGPTVLLFPLDAEGANQPFTLTEGPNRIWVKELLDKFRP